MSCTNGTDSEADFDFISLKCERFLQKEQFKKRCFVIDSTGNDF